MSEETIKKRTAARIAKYGTYTQNWGGGEPKRGSANKMAKRVRCIETGIEYPSAIEASQATGIQYNLICENARGVRKKDAGGFNWEYIDPPVPRKKRSQESIDKVSGANSKCAKPIRCIETGEVFGTSALLADHLGVNRPRVTKFMRSGQIFNGLHYEYVDKGELKNGTIVSESQERTGTD